MPDYRLYFLDMASHIQRAEDLCAGDDSAAIGLAEKRAAAEPLELWTGPRMVWRFDPALRTAEAARA